MKIVEFSGRLEQSEPRVVLSMADQIILSLNRLGWDLGLSGFARANGSKCWIVFGSRGSQTLHAEGESQMEALLEASRLAKG